MPSGSSRSDLERALVDALILVSNSIVLVERSVYRHPSADEARTLQATQLDLQVRRSTMEARLSALQAGAERFVVPHGTEVVEIRSLSSRIESMAATVFDIPAAISMVSTVLALLGPHGPGDGPNQ